ncbi:hypothetical protein CI15_23575 [Paraburkholderia monticola]|uniref:Uncharacterized protein n=1 Tax=Paraburkholderia monticola TaxID=1399968 RepID=A0A149PHB2_9BURK|nr:hypothetical protein [Paraburkholderia monticola]KXU84447.1 hypothetical protein CI15_23575 [Paraburkholderia monticola]
MDRTHVIEGQPVSFEAVTPSLVGFLFGTNAYLFNLTLDQTQQDKTKIKQQSVAIRLDTFLRCPSLENFHVEVTGSFDKDEIFRAQYVDVKDTGIRLRGALRLSPALACLLLVAIPVTVVATFYVYWGFLVYNLTSLAESVLPGWNVPVWEKKVHFVAILGFFLLFVLVLPALIFLSRTVLPSLLEPIVRLLDRISSYY